MAKITTAQLKKLIVDNIMPKWVADEATVVYPIEDHSMDDCLNISKWKRMSKRKVSETSEIDSYSFRELKHIIQRNAKSEYDIVVLDSTKHNEKHYIERIFHFDPDNIDYFGVAIYTDAADENVVMYEIIQD